MIYPWETISIVSEGVADSVSLNTGKNRFYLAYCLVQRNNVRVFDKIAIEKL